MKLMKSTISSTKGNFKGSSQEFDWTLNLTTIFRPSLVTTEIVSADEGY